jgi:hypothetical protein
LGVFYEEAIFNGKGSITELQFFNAFELEFVVGVGKLSLWVIPEYYPSSWV